MVLTEYKRATTELSANIELNHRILRHRTLKTARHGWWRVLLFVSGTSFMRKTSDDKPSPSIANHENRSTSHLAWAPALSETVALEK